MMACGEDGSASARFIIKHDFEMKRICAMHALLLEVNICDDLFKERKRSREIQQARDDAERESYAAKHDLVNMQMKLETTLRELENTQKKLAELEAKQAARDARDRALASTKK